MQPRANLFYALWPDDATRAGLVKLQTQLRGRLTRQPNLHLTLAFLGPQPDALQPLLRSILTRLEFTPMTLEINRVGHFPKNRIAWAGMHETPSALAQLQRTLTQELARKGIRSDNDRAYRPHITLARDAEPRDEQPFDPVRWHADHVVLARSPLPGEKPFYQLLAARKITEPTLF